MLRFRLRFVFSLLTALLVVERFVAGSKNLPDNFKRCSRNDPALNSCLKDAVQDSIVKLKDGLPDLKFPSLEPLKIPSAIIGAGKGPVNVEQKFRNIEVHNISTAVVKFAKTQITEQGAKLEVQGYVDLLTLTAEYSFNGKILVLPIQGDGPCTVQMIGLTVDILIDSESFEKNGITYLKVKETKIKLDPSKVTFNFENLFNGDVRLGTEMNKVMNENYKAVFDDVKSGYEELLGAIILNACNRIFEKVPMDKLFPQ